MRSLGWTLRPSLEDWNNDSDPTFDRGGHVKKPGFSRWPYLASGVAIGSKPLQKLVLAAGYGPAIAQFYAGVLFNTQLRPTASKCGSIPMVPVTGDLKNKTCPEFTMGLNLSVGSVIEALKPKKDTGGTPATK